MLFVDCVKVDKILFVCWLWLFLGGRQALEQASGTTCVQTLEGKRDVYPINTFLI